MKRSNSIFLLMTCVFATGTDFVCAQLVRGPYLQLGTPTSVVVRWRTSALTNGVVYYGNEPTNLTLTASGGGSETNHVVSISGLSPFTKYFYAIGSSNEIFAGAESNYFFVTSPSIGETKRSRIWILGDSGTANANARSVRDAYYTWTGTNTQDFWMMLGDNAYNDGTDLQYQSAVFDMYTQTLVNAVLWSTMGNHDGHSADSATQTGPYYDIFTLPTGGEAGGLASGTEAYYSFDYAHIHFICLDSYDSDRSPGGAMMTWMASDVAATTQKWIIAFWHHPPYTKGSHDSDSESALIQMRTNALPILEAYGVDLVLTGHSHSYERSYLLYGHYGSSSTFASSNQVDAGDGQEDSDGGYNKGHTNGTVYIVAGSSGQASGGSLNHPAMYVSLNTLGSLVLDVDSNRMDACFIDDTAGVSDYFTIYKDTNQYLLSIGTNGLGSVAPTGGLYNANVQVTLSATASNYYQFDGWSGDLGGSTNPVAIRMSGAKNITAEFGAILVTNAVPQWWLAQYGLDTNDTAALADQDSDGHAAWQEYTAGTVPTSSLSVFEITDIVESNLQTLLVWSSVTGKTYDILMTTNLFSNFSPLITNQAANPPYNEYIVTNNADGAGIFTIDVH